MRERNDSLSQRGTGYTVVEFLVVIAVIVMLTTMMIAGYLRFDRKRKAEGAALNFAQFLQTQKKRANSGDTEGCELSGLGNPNPLAGYDVTAADGSDRATSQPACTLAAGYSPKQHQLLNQTEFAGDFNVRFLPLSLGVTITEGSVQVVKGSNRYRVAVDGQGAITVEEGS